MSFGNKSKLRHGHARVGHVTPEYAAWLSLKHRNPEELCPRWQTFEAWLADVGPRPAPRLGRPWRFGRTDPERPWEPGNARWALAPLEPAYVDY